MPMGSPGDIDPSLATLPNPARMQHIALKKENNREMLPYSISLNRGLPVPRPLSSEVRIMGPSSRHSANPLRFL